MKQLNPVKKGGMTERKRAFVAGFSCDTGTRVATWSPGIFVSETSSSI